MKNFNITIYMLLLMLVSTLVDAQKIQSYVIKARPFYVLEEGGPITVKELTNNGSTMNTFGKDFATTLYNTINWEERGLAKKGKAKVYNPWYTTKIYELTKDESAAKYVISGNYVFSGQVTKSDALMKSKDYNQITPIPFFYYKHSVDATAIVDGVLTITSTSTGEVVKQFSLKNEKTKSDFKFVDYPSTPTIDKYTKALAKDVISRSGGMFSPVFVTKTYSFKSIKGNKSDKVYKKELKNKKKVFKSLAKTGSVNELGKAYQEIIANASKIKKPQNLYYNLGLCYELLGNYTKAKENYLKSADKDAIVEIDYLISMKDLFVKLGLNVVENDF